MFTSRSSTREERVEERVERSAEPMKCRTCFAPSRNVYPQSPSPTMVSYSVIVGSSLMTLSQPKVMILRTWESENWILEVCDAGLVTGAEEVVAASVFKGRACAVRKVVGMEQREMAQPRVWEEESRIVDWVIYEGRLLFAGGRLARGCI